MTDDKRFPEDRDVEALLARLPADAPPADVQERILRRALERYDQTAQLPVTYPWQFTFKQVATIMTHPVSRTIAALAAVFVILAWLIVPRSSIAFGDLLAPIVEAKTCKFKTTMTNDVQKQPIAATCYFRAPNAYRQEFDDPKLSGMVTIADFENGKMLSLMPGEKKAMIFELQNKPADLKGQTNNFFGNLRASLAEYRANKKSQLEELGEKEIDGRRAFGFRLAASGMLQTLWGDVASGRLIRVEASYAGPPKSDVVMSDFQFDLPLDAKLFAFDVPEGYETVSVPIDASPATEQDFVASLRQLSDAMEGAFPSSLDTPGIALALVKLIKGKDTKEQMTQGSRIARGLSFAMMLSAAKDAHYAGKGAKRAGAKSPLFWYKPADDKQYRVIWTDLSASDADAAPNVPGAIRMFENFKKPAPAGE